MGELQEIIPDVAHASIKALSRVDVYFNDVVKSDHQLHIAPSLGPGSCARMRDPQAYVRARCFWILIA